MACYLFKFVSPRRGVLGVPISLTYMSRLVLHLIPKRPSASQSNRPDRACSGNNPNGHDHAGSVQRSRIWIWEPLISERDRHPVDLRAVDNRIECVEIAFPKQVFDSLTLCSRSYYTDILLLPCSGPHKVKMCCRVDCHGARSSLLLCKSLLIFSDFIPACRDSIWFGKCSGNAGAICRSYYQFVKDQDKRDHCWRKSHLVFLDLMLYWFIPVIVS